MSKMAEMAFYNEQARMREEMEMAEAEWTGAVECFEHTSGGGVEDPVVARCADERAFPETIPETLDRLAEPERGFRDEVKARRLRGKTLRLPAGRTDMRRFANGLARSIRDFNSTGDPKIDELGWTENPFDDRPTHPEAI